MKRISPSQQIRQALEALWRNGLNGEGDVPGLLIRLGAQRPAQELLLFQSRTTWAVATTSDASAEGSIVAIATGMSQGVSVAPVVSLISSSGS